jgi:hypothetical protein
MGVDCTLQPTLTHQPERFAMTFAKTILVITLMASTSAAAYVAPPGTLIDSSRLAPRPAMPPAPRAITPPAPPPVTPPGPPLRTFVPPPPKQPPAQAKAQPAQQHPSTQHAVQPSHPTATPTTTGQGTNPLQTTTPQQPSPVKSEPAKVDPNKVDLTVHPKEPDKNAVRTLEPLKDVPQPKQRFEGGGAHVPDGQDGSQTVIVGKDNKTGLGIEATRRELPGAPADNKLQLNYTSDPNAPPPQKDPVRPEGEVPPGR